MTKGALPSPEKTYVFGPFRLLAAQQLLFKANTPVRLGSRALALLSVLVQRPGELIGKDELMALAWPQAHLEESNLKVQIGVLRKTLGKRPDGQEYIATTNGRGYRFVARVELVGQALPPGTTGAPTASSPPHSATVRVIGRMSTRDTLLRSLPQHRFITIVGAGGVGKTTVALSVMRALDRHYQHGNAFVDLAPLRDPQHIPSAIASALGLSLHTDNVRAALLAYLRDKHVLLVLDNCEHLVEAVAGIAEQMTSAAPGVHLLTTTREPLRARGERVYRLSPLEYPPTTAQLTAAQALTFPAVELFVDRAVAVRGEYQLSDHDAPIIAEICRKLDGNALAIELVATRTDAFATREILTLLDEGFRLLTRGRRTALPRHQTLTATLDWSYQLLTESDHVVIQGLATFAGTFTLESAIALAGSATLSRTAVIESITNLVSKSLLSADVRGAVAHYRLLETTRAYAFGKLEESGELDTWLRRHAAFARDVLRQAEVESKLMPTPAWLSTYARWIDDVRNALSWAFSAKVDLRLAVELTVAALPLWLQLSLLEECRAAVELALARGSFETHPLDEMKLYAALGTALLHGKGPEPEVPVIWGRALQMSEQLGDHDYQLRVLWGLSCYRVFAGEYRGALALLRRYRSTARQHGDLADQLSCNRLTATVLHYLGRLGCARRRLQGVLDDVSLSPQQSYISRFQFDQRGAAQGTLSHVLWLQGYPEQAARVAHSAIETARAADHPISLCSALAHAAFPIALYMGDLPGAERLLSILHEHLTRHALRVWNTVAQCLLGQMAAQVGDVLGLASFKAALAELLDNGYRLRYSFYQGALAQGFARAGQLGPAHEAVDTALDWAYRSKERWCVPELLRIRGEILRLEASPAALAEAGSLFLQSMRVARSQRALSWELRAATSLAQLRVQQRENAAAHATLAPVYNRFVEGFQTQDLVIARTVLDEASAGS